MINFFLCKIIHFTSRVSTLGVVDVESEELQVFENSKKI